MTFPRHNLELYCKFNVIYKRKAEGEAHMLYNSSFTRFLVHLSREYTA